MQHTFFVHFFAVVLHDYNVKLPETYLSYTIFGGNVVRVLVHFFFTAAHFHLALVAASISHAYRWILVYICCLISTDLSLSDEANIMKFLNLKEHNNFSYLWKFEPDGPNSFGEILFEKPQNLQRMYELIHVLPPSNFAVFSCCYFLCFWLHELHKSTSTFNFWTLLLHTATSSMG